LFNSKEEIEKKIKDYDYVDFLIGKFKNSEYKSELQAYSLEKTDKEISCCDYYVSSFGLKDFIVFTSKFAFKRIGNDANKLININQLMLRKNYFLEHLTDFQNLADNKNFNLINEENTAFISIPLISIKQLRKIDYEKMKKAFEMRFPNELFSLIYQKKLLTNKYPYFLTIKSLIGNSFIFKYLLELLKDKSSKDKLSVNKAYIENSSLEKLIKTT
jgi:hypothetical protein